MSAVYKIVDAKDTIQLESKMSKYNISMLGALTVINGHFYQAIIGELKEVEITKEVTKEIPKLETKTPAKKRVSKVKPKLETKTLLTN